MQITEESTRFVFREYTDNELSILRKLISADGNHFLYEDEDWVACPIGVENYIKRKFPSVNIKKNDPWPSAKMKYIPKELPPPRDKLQKDALKFMKEYKDRPQLGLICAPGQGKCIPITAKIPTPDGFKTMGDLEIGDYVFTEEGTKTKIVAIYDQNESDIYRVTLDDGRTADCTFDHLWAVTDDDNDMHFTVKPLSKIIDEFNDGQSVYIPKAGPVVYNAHMTTIDPWIVGAFIACGDHTASEFKINTSNIDVVKRICRMTALSYQKVSDDTYSFSLNGVPVLVNDFFKDLADDLRSGDIPHLYIFNDIHTRLHLIQGMMDCRGNISHDDSGYITRVDINGISSTDFITLIQSLGFGARVVNDQFIEIITSNDSLCMFFSIGDKYDIAIDADDDNDDATYSKLKIVDIQKIDFARTRCIEVDSPTHLFLTENFVVTHNTYMSIKHAIDVGEKTLIICPTTSILQQWIETLTDMYKIPPNRILHVNSTAKLSLMANDYDWVLVLEQTLQTLVRKNELEPLLKRCQFGMKITDEIHMFLRNNIAIDCCSNIKRSVYLTGTFFRTQEEESNLFNAVYHGILRFEVVDQDDIEHYGQKKHIEIYSVVIDSKLTKREVNHIIVNAKIGKKSARVVSVGRYMQIVCPDDGRVTEYMKQSLQVIKRMHERVDYGRMLILVPSISATKQFRRLIANMYPKLKVGCINSEQSRSLNTRVKEEADIVVSTSKSAGVGFDMKDLSVLIAVEQFRSPVMVEQISGRLRPRKDGKSCYYVDIADKALGQYLLRWRTERLERLKVKAKSYKQFKVSSDN